MTAGAGQIECWCCGCSRSPDDVVRLGDHPEVALCLPCAHWVHQQARAIEDAARRTPAARLRDVVRAARGLVLRRGWHRAPVIGGALRRLGRHLP